MQNTHSRDVWVQLQITKYCITNISAQLLLSKHRHSKKPTGAKSQQVTSQGYLQSKDIDRILIIYFFSRSTCRCEIRNDKNLSCWTTEEREENHKIHPSFRKEGNKIRANLPESNKTLANRHEAKLPIRISHL